MKEECKPAPNSLAAISTTNNYKDDYHYPNKSAYRPLGRTDKAEAAALAEARAELAAANAKFAHQARGSPKRPSDGMPLDPGARATWTLIGRLNAEVGALRATRPASRLGRREWHRRRLPHLLARGVLLPADDSQEGLNSIPSSNTHMSTQSQESTGVSRGRGANRFQRLAKNPGSSQGF